MSIVCSVGSEVINDMKLRSSAFVRGSLQEHFFDNDATGDAIGVDVATGYALVTFINSLNVACKNIQKITLL